MTASPALGPSGGAAKAPLGLAPLSLAAAFLAYVAMRALEGVYGEWGPYRSPACSALAIGHVSLISGLAVLAVMTKGSLPFERVARASRVVVAVALWGGTLRALWWPNGVEVGVGAILLVACACFATVSALSYGAAARRAGWATIAVIALTDLYIRELARGALTDGVLLAYIPPALPPLIRIGPYAW